MRGIPRATGLRRCDERHADLRIRFRDRREHDRLRGVRASRRFGDGVIRDLRHDQRARAIPIVAIVSLLATFAANVFRIPAGIAGFYPVFVIAWFAFGAVLLRARPSDVREVA